MTNAEAIERLAYVRANALHQRDAGVSQYWQQEIDGTIEALNRAIEALADRKDEPQTCDTCKHDNEPWYSDACDGCCKAHSSYEPIEDEPTTEQSSMVEPQTDCAWK